MPSPSESLVSAGVAEEFGEGLGEPDPDGWSADGLGLAGEVPGWVEVTGFEPELIGTLPLGGASDVGVPSRLQAESDRIRVREIAKGSTGLGPRFLLGNCIFCLG